MTNRGRVWMAVFGAVVVASGCSSPSSGSATTSPADAGAGADAAAADSAAPPDGDARGVDAAPASNAPINAPADQWTWVDFPASRCASGTPTGIGVNPHPGSDKVVIYLSGGGGCTTGMSCWGPDPSAHSLDGYDATKFAATPQLKLPLLSRSLQGNPLADANMVFVPYCTGDLHSGEVTADLTLDGKTIPTNFWGARNIAMYLARLVPTFVGTTRVFLAGGSAGGFGTLVNFDRVASAFGVRVDVIDDSGPPITGKGASGNGALGIWGYVAPAGCADCSSLPKIYAYDRAQQPNSRYGLLSFAQDTIISKDFGYTLEEYSGVIDAFKTSIAGDSNAATFVVTNATGHVVQSVPMLAPQYLPWIAQMVSNSAAWTSVTYVTP